MNTEAMHKALAGSLAGKLTFPQVIAMLSEAGIESYRVDFLTRTDVFYLPGGRTHTESMNVPSIPVAGEFAADELKAMIREAQADTLRYPQFVERSLAAGVAGYHVFITGRRAIYFGRKGELHTELFPQAKTS